VITQQFGFQKTPLRGMAKNRWKVNVIADLINLLLDRHIYQTPVSSELIDMNSLFDVQ
jgi:hypothetical protein